MMSSHMGKCVVVRAKLFFYTAIKRRPIDVQVQTEVYVLLMALSGCQGVTVCNRSPKNKPQETNKYLNTKGVFLARWWHNHRLPHARLKKRDNR